MISLLKWELAEVAMVDNALGGEQAELQAGCGSEVEREVRRLGVLLSRSVVTSSALPTLLFVKCPGYLFSLLGDFESFYSYIPVLLALLPRDHSSTPQL